MRSIAVAERVRGRAREAWHVLIKDHHEGYLSWDTYERDQARSKRTGGLGSQPRRGARRYLVVAGSGAVRALRAFDEGQLPTRQGAIRYLCRNAHRQTGQALCQSFGAGRLERALEQLVLQALEPVALKAMMQASVLHAQAGSRDREHTEQRLERACYEVDLARRQYDAVDPANRLVARELERRWERALEEHARIETEASARLEALQEPLSVEERAQLQRFAQDLPSLWQSPAPRCKTRSASRVV